MAKGHIQRGEVVDWTNGSGSDVASGDVVFMADMIGIALNDIDDGEQGVLALGEVWELPKEAGLDIDQGARVYWDAVAGEIDTTDTNVPAGKAFQPAAAADAVVQVLVNG